MVYVDKWVRIGDGTPVLNKGQWATATDYAVDDVVYNSGTSFICILAHTSGSANEPTITITPSVVITSEVLTGTVDGSNNTFTFASNFLSGTETVYINGLAQVAGVSYQYVATPSTGTIVFNSGCLPQTGDTVTGSSFSTSSSDLSTTAGTYWQVFCAGSPGQTGPTGSDGTSADTGDWITSTAYALNDRCYHTVTGYGKSVFRCTSAHTSGASTEPTVGASWATKWEYFAKGGADGAGSGDFVGPASSTTNNLVSYADTTGKLGKDAGTPKSVVDTVLLAETASTTTPSGTTDSFLVDENGTMKRKTANSMAKKNIHVNINAGSWAATATSGCNAASQTEMTTSDLNFYILGFVHTAKKYATATFELPDGYDGGTISAYVTWYTAGTTSNGVRFGLQGYSVGDDQTLDGTWGTAVEVTDSATGAAYKRLKTSVMSGITLARSSGSPTGGDTCALRLYRDPTHGDDVLDATIYVLGVTLKIGINKHSE